MEVLIPIFGILLVLVPVTGITAILTMRFALKPFVETLARALRESGYAGYTSGPELQAQVDDLSEQLAAMAAEVHRLREAQDFDRQLVAGAERDAVPK